MKKTRKSVRRQKMILAWSYAIGGALLCVGSVISMILTHMSGTFLPTYIGGEFNLFNRILRLVLYFVLLVVLTATAWLSGYGYKYLANRYHGRKKRYL